MFEQYIEDQKTMEQASEMLWLVQETYTKVEEITVCLHVSFIVEQQTMMVVANDKNEAQAMFHKNKGEIRDGFSVAGLLCERVEDIPMLFE